MAKHVRISLDEEEMLLLIFEGLIDIPRPTGMTNQQAIADIERGDPLLLPGLLRAARNMGQYFVQQVEDGRREQ